jgi:hypothetical protein
MNKQSSSKASSLGLRHVALASALCCAGLAQAQTDSSVTLESVCACAKPAQHSALASAT